MSDSGPTLEEIHAVIEMNGGNRTDAATQLGISRHALRRRIKRLSEEQSTQIDGVVMPDIPTDDLPVTDIIDHLSSRFEKRRAAVRARKWMRIGFESDLPIGICFLGDPHVDDSNCDWPQLRRDVDIISSTEGMYGASVGDAVNNWAPRLARLWAEQDTSRHTAWKLSRWLLSESGVDWLMWVMGNHDEWNDGSTILREMGGHPIWMHDWQAQVELGFPKGQACRIHIAHDFPGHSMWNSLHGPQKAAHMREPAHIYVAGHKHNWAMHQEESASRGFVYNLIRARGYKAIDHFGERLGHFPQEEGQAIVAVIDPMAKSMASFVDTYADAERGAMVLNALRRQRRKEGVE